MGNGLDGNSFIRVPSQPQDRKAPYLQLQNMGKYVGEDPVAAKPIFQTVMGWTDEVCDLYSQL